MRHAVTITEGLVGPGQWYVSIDRIDIGTEPITFDAWDVQSQHADLDEAKAAAVSIARGFRLPCILRRCGCQFEGVAQ